MRTERGYNQRALALTEPSESRGHITREKREQREENSVRGRQRGRETVENKGRNLLWKKVVWKSMHGHLFLKFLRVGKLIL